MTWVKGKSWNEVLGEKKANEKREQLKKILIKRNKSSKQRDIISKRKGEKNPVWKGDDVSYSALHKWLNVHKPKPELCEECHKKKATDCANISGEYKRNINDYRWMCRKCHMIFDGTFELLTKKGLDKAREKIEGKTWEEICGIDRAKERKSQLLRDENTGRFK